MLEDDLPSGFIDDLKTGVTYEMLEEEYDISRSKARNMFDHMREHGYPVEFQEINQHGKREFYLPDESGNSYVFDEDNGRYHIALLSDTHLGAKYTHENDLEDYYKRLRDRGVKHFFHSGDISDGWEIYEGQLNGTVPEAHGWQNMMDYTIENYPDVDGAHTFFIMGNHDRKLYKREGVNIGKIIDEYREDLHYIGDSRADIVLDEENDINLELLHPLRGDTYTLGYRLQTLYRERPLDDRPTIAAVGHLHSSMFAKSEGVYGFYTGAWKDLSTFNKRQGHAADIGGWELELLVEDGEIRELRPNWIGYSAFEKDNQYSMKDINEFLEGDE